MTRREALDWFLGRVGELGDAVARNRAERSLTAAATFVPQVIMVL